MMVRDRSDLRDAVCGHAVAAGRAHQAPPAGDVRAPGRGSILPLAGLAIYLLTSSVYVLPPGLPQPSDLLLCATLGVSFAFVWRRPSVDPILCLLLLLFVGWIVVVNTTWFMMLTDVGMMQRSLFYVFNALVLLFVVAMGRLDLARTRRVVAVFSALALILTAIYLAVFGDPTAARAYGSFNNPNQMAYWVLLMLICLSVARGRDVLSFFDVVAITCGAYIIVLSLSKAAAVAGGALILLIILTRRWSRKTFTLMLVGALFVVGTSLMGDGVLARLGSAKPMQALNHRLAMMGTQDDDSLGHRGYDRLSYRVDLVAFGAGEGAFERLSPRRSGQEFHSSLGTLLISYGVIGLGLFGILMGYVFTRAGLVNSLYLVPVMLYGITHMGLRDSLFWIFVGLALVCGSPDRRAASKS